MKISADSLASILAPTIGGLLNTSLVLSKSVGSGAHLYRIGKQNTGLHLLQLSTDIGYYSLFCFACVYYDTRNQGVGLLKAVNTNYIGGGTYAFYKKGTDLFMWVSQGVNGMSIRVTPVGFSLTAVLEEISDFDLTDYTKLTVA